MNVDHCSISKAFSDGGRVQFTLPLFQRQYAWGNTEWKALFDDILETYKASKTKKIEHFLGSLVVIKRDDVERARFSAYTLVDGQQRLTSISLLLRAMQDLSPEDSSLQREIDPFLVNDNVDGDLRYKILPTKKYDDRDTYCALMRGEVIPDSSRSNIKPAYDYFRRVLEKKTVSGEIDMGELLRCVTTSLYIVFIELDQSDKPYRIFESLNHRGKALTQADLVRNFIAMRLPVKKQEEVFDSAWSAIEDKLDDQRNVGRVPELSAFLRHYLTFQLGRLPSDKQIYDEFRDCIERCMPKDDDFIDEIRTLSRFASYYDKILRPGHEHDRAIREKLKRLHVFAPVAAYPLLLYYFGLYEEGDIDKVELCNILQVVENYIVRRFVAKQPASYLNRMFPPLAQELRQKGEHSYRQLESALLEKSYLSNKRIKSRMSDLPIYSSNAARAIVFVLEQLEKCFDSGIKLDGKGTVEHIMPQRLSPAWEQVLGADWRRIHRDSLHLWGNLTIVNQDWNNRKLSNKPFSEKRQELRSHGLSLNSHYFKKHLDTWDEAAIKKRSDYLADLIAQVWPYFESKPSPKR